MSSIQAAARRATLIDGFEDHSFPSTPSIAKLVSTAIAVANASIAFDLPVSNAQSNRRICAQPYGFPHETRKRAVFSLRVTNTLLQW